MAVEQLWLEEVRVPITRQPVAVRSLLSLVAAKHTPTYSHMTRVALYSQFLAEHVKLNRSEVKTVTMAALLHDIGKLAIPDAILTKPGRLTDAEMRTMCTHADAGAQILARYEPLSDLAPIVRYHHEWWDGRGYPTGLSASKIPLGSRIISIADAFDTMTTPRPYAAPRPQEQCLAELERCAGTQFDPDLTQAFVQLIRSGAVEEGQIEPAAGQQRTLRPEPLALRMTD